MQTNTGCPANQDGQERPFDEAVATAKEAVANAEVQSSSPRVPEAGLPRREPVAVILG